MSPYLPIKILNFIQTKWYLVLFFGMPLLLLLLALVWYLCVRRR